MKSATFAQPPNALGAVIDLPGGIRVADALAKAAQNLESIRAPSLEAIDRYLSELEILCADPAARPSEVTARRIYDLSNDILGIAGVFNLDELGMAAYSLCELVDCFSEISRWNQLAVIVHISAFRFLRNSDANSDYASILEGLNRLVERAREISA